MALGIVSLTEVTSWLLEADNPSVRFWTLQDLVDQKSSDTAVRAVQDDIMDSPQVKLILGKQQPGGWWMGERDMYLPKYTATTHSLLLLAELGAKRTPAVERGVEFIFRFQRDTGHFLTKLPATEKGQASLIKDGCCIDGNILYYLIYFGYIDDPRTRKLLDFIVDYHSPDCGGWKCRSYPINPDKVFPKNCYMGATKMLRALSTIPIQKRSMKLKTVIDQEVENILKNSVFRYLRNTGGSRKEKVGWKRFGFPLFYQSDTLEVLDTLTRLGIHDERMQPAIDVVSNARKPNGRWLLENTFNGKMLIEIEEKGKPSKWITLRALRVLKRIELDNKL
jgi:hypothetical protein